MSVGFRMLSLMGVAVLFGLAPIAIKAWPQDSQSQQSSSVADAARRAKVKKNSAKASKVIDDDNLLSNLKTGGADVTNVGASAAATVNPDTAAKPDATGDQPAPQRTDQTAAKRDDQDAAEQDAEIATVKALVAQTEKELDLLKRGFALDSEAYYSKADYSSDKAGKAKLDGEQQQIADKQQELDGVKARLAALHEQRSRRKAKSNAPPTSEAEKPAAPPQL
jgi:hypothetical protein